MKVAVSFLSSESYKDCIKKIDESNADFIHVDLCDGKYVENKNFTLKNIVDLLKKTRKPLDVHFMCVNPIKYIDAFAMLNTSSITIHLDSMENPLETINYIKNIGLKVGIAVNPDDDLNILNGYLDKIDKILIMSVVPGKGGQQFLQSIIPKIDRINEIKDQYHFITSVDGGINGETVSYLAGKNIDLIISGSFVTNSDDMNERIKEIRLG